MKNLHDLLAKLAWDFSPEQLDHLFECFQVRPLPGRPGVLYFLIYVFETPQTLGVCKQNAVTLTIPNAMYVTTQPYF